MSVSQIPAVRPTRLRLRIVSQCQFAAGLVFLAIGVAAFLIATGYPMGTAGRMGPGFFPLVVSAILAVLGLASCVASLTARTSDRIGEWPVVPLLFVITGVVGFGLLIEPAGLVASSAFLLLCCCYERWRRRTLEAVFLSATLIGFVVLLFVRFLGMPIEIF
jgi:hypothetical protein